MCFATQDQLLRHKWDSDDKQSVPAQTFPKHTDGSLRTPNAPSIVYRVGVQLHEINVNGTTTTTIIYQYQEAQWKQMMYLWSRVLLPPFFKFNFQCDAKVLYTVGPRVEKFFRAENNVSMTWVERQLFVPYQDITTTRTRNQVVLLVTRVGSYSERRHADSRRFLRLPKWGAPGANIVESCAFLL